MGTYCARNVHGQLEGVVLIHVAMKEVFMGRSHDLSIRSVSMLGVKGHLVGIQDTMPVNA